MRSTSLNLKIFLLTLFILLAELILLTVIIQFIIRRQIVDDGGRKVETTARLIAADPRIVNAFALQDPSEVLQPLTLRMMELTEVSFIVIIDTDSIRYSHPDPEKIGLHFVGGDEQPVLQGKDYVSIARGTLGISIRAFVPIRNPRNQVIGAAVVGLLLENLKEIQRVITSTLYLVSALGSIIGGIGAFLLARHVKKSIYGLEPKEIANLLTQHHAIISSIREGVLAIDLERRIILINEQAKKILKIQENPIGQDVYQFIPQSRLPDVIANKRPILDSEMNIDRAHIMTNRLPLFHAGDIIGAVATFRDMSEIQELAEELTEVKSYISALRAQHHEHLNHLQVVSGLMQLSHYAEAVSFINSMTEYQQAISDFILENIKDPGLSGLILAKIRDAEEKGIEVNLNPDTDIPRLEKGVLSDIVSICGNLIQNAIDELVLYRKEDRHPRIDLFLVLTNMGLYIEVGDNGRGLAVQPSGDIFKEGVSTKGSPKSRGMGLALVKFLTEKRKGTIHFDSSDRGCLFTVRIPAANLEGRT